jgi:hypothetical protein
VHFNGWTSIIVKILSMPDLPSDEPLHHQIPVRRMDWEVHSGVEFFSVKSGIVIMGLMLVGVRYRKRMSRIARDFA